MREIVFKRYWRFACLPGLSEGLIDERELVDGRTGTYRATMELLDECVAAW